MRRVHALNVGILALAFAAAAPALADDGCAAKAMDQVSMNACAQQDMQAADAELNQVYRAIRKRHAGEPVFLDALKAAQQTWIRLRDQDLAAQFPLTRGEVAQIVYGSIYNYEYAGAKAELTRIRTAYLRKQFLGAGAS
jgi:uncharacterized protein YecT (DUF1311 family)